MGLRVNTNVASLTAKSHLQNVSWRLEGNYKRLASGLRIATASDDPAGLGISERMRSQLASIRQASRNGQDGVSLVQTAEGALAEVTQSLTRMRELAIEAANGTLNTTDRAVLDTEFQAHILEIDRIAETTTFNGVNLLNNAGSSVDIQIGTEAGQVISIDMLDTRDSALGLSGATFNLTTISNATASLSTIDTAITSVTTARGEMGASQNRITSAIRSLSNAEQNLAAAESRIRDVDLAVETADLTRNSILQQSSVSVLSQANLQPQVALSLLG